MLNNDKIDFFIDAVATRGVKKNFKMYSPLVRPGEIIAFNIAMSGVKKILEGNKKTIQLWKS